MFSCLTRRRRREREPGVSLHYELGIICAGWVRRVFVANLHGLKTAGYENIVCYAAGRLFTMKKRGARAK